MPIGSFLGLETTLRGLVAQQRSLDTTGHNISNASTAGYSRQTVGLTASRALDVAGGGPSGGGVQLGTGVTVLTYTRVRDQFLDVQFRGQASLLGDAAARARSLDQVELALAEPGEDGLSARLDRFYDAWSDLANAPNDQGARQALLDITRGLNDMLHSLDSQMVRVQTDAASERATLLAPDGDVQNAAIELADLNDAIAGATARGAVPNDLLDRRDVVLDKLASFAQIRVEDVPGRPGALTVFLGDLSATATPLVDGAAPGPGAVAPWPLVVPPGTGGQLAALGAIGDTAAGPVAAYRTELATFARTLADAVNTAHPSFFTYTPGNEAATLDLAPGLTAATVRAATVPGGDNDIALAVAGLRGQPADQIYTGLVTRIGEDLRAAQRTETRSQVLLDAVEDRRQSVSGVSLDEEMTNLVRFQRAYQASARAMSVVDDVLDTLINRTGRVGL